MNLNDVHRGIHKHKKRKRVGRGPGSGHGKTSGRGHKGQGQLAGWTAHPAFEGGQMPLVRRVPKRGFHNPFKKRSAIINLAQLEAFSSGSEVTPEILVERGLIRGRDGRVKILGDGSLTKRLTVKAHGFSAKAKEKIEAAGGKAELIVSHA